MARPWGFIAGNTLLAPDRIGVNYCIDQPVVVMPTAVMLSIWEYLCGAYRCFGEDDQFLIYPFSSNGRLIFADFSWGSLS